MSEQNNKHQASKKHAIFVGVWPLADAHDPALDDVGIPAGATVFGLFDENYKKYNAPDSIPGLTMVSLIEELAQDTYFILNTLSGFDYIVLMANNSVDITIQIDEYEDDISRIKNEIRANLDHTLLDSALEFIDCLHTEQLTPQQWFGPGYWRIPWQNNYLFGIHLYGLNPAANSKGWVFWFFSGDYNGTTDEDIIELVQDNIGYCVKCSKDCKTNGNQGVDMTIFGKKHANMCWQFPVRINDPDNETLVKVQKLIGFWKNMASSSDSIHVRD